MMMNIGEAILTSENLQSIWTSFYNTGFGRLSQFYNTLTMGSLALSLALSPLVLIVSRILVVKYREHFLAWVEQWRILQIIKGSRVYQMYQRFGG